MQLKNRVKATIFVTIWLFLCLLLLVLWTAPDVLSGA